MKTKLLKTGLLLFFGLIAYAKIVCATLPPTSGGSGVVLDWITIPGFMPPAPIIPPSPTPWPPSDMDWFRWLNEPLPRAAVVNARIGQDSRENSALLGRFGAGEIVAQLTADSEHCKGKGSANAAINTTHEIGFTTFSLRVVATADALNRYQFFGGCTHREAVGGAGVVFVDAFQIDVPSDLEVSINGLLGGIDERTRSGLTVRITNLQTGNPVITPVDIDVSSGYEEHSQTFTNQLDRGRYLVEVILVALSNRLNERDGVRSALGHSNVILRLVKR